MANKPPVYVPYHRGGRRFNLTLQTDALVQKYATGAYMPPRVCVCVWVATHRDALPSRLQPGNRVQSTVTSLQRVALSVFGSASSVRGAAIPPPQHAAS